MDSRSSTPRGPSVSSYISQTSTSRLGRESSRYFSSDSQYIGNDSRSLGSSSRTITPDSSSPWQQPAQTPSYESQTSMTDSASGSYITRPVTSYTSRASRTPLPRQDKFDIICALSEARGVTPSVGLASINTTTGEVILSQISDNRFFVRTLHMLQILEPSRILIVSTSCPPNPKSRLYSHIEEHMVGTKTTPMDRKYWSEIEGLSRIDTYAFREDAESVKVALKGSFYATCSFSAAMSYLENELALRIVPHTLRVRYKACEDTMMIDISTIISLEILQNLRKQHSTDCLIGLLKQTRTPMGSRVLRSNLLQPSTLKESFLESRYEAVEELVKTPEVFLEVREALKGLPDVETMLTKLVIMPPNPSIAATEAAMDNVLKVKTFVDAVPGLFSALGPVSSPLLIKIRNLFRPEMFAPVRDLIYETLHPDVAFAKAALDRRNQRMFAVQTGVHGLLDVARQTYRENTEEVHKHVEQLNSALEIDAKLEYHTFRRYCLRLRAVDFEDRPVPDVLVNRMVKRGKLECTTLRLKQLNQRISDSVAEVVMLSDKVIQDLVDSIRTQIAPLYRICDSIAILDMVASFAHASSTHDWVRPQISDTLALNAARHPIMDKTLPGQMIPNDYYAAEDYHFQVITGCNMSGKTTYIRGIALLQIMAQVGCFVPAESATFPIIHSMFARVSTDDSIESNLSSFSLEMREMAFILNNVDDRSMVIIDELGRSTSTRDGLAISIAMSEALIQSRAAVWFATHFTEIAEVLKDRPGVLNLNLASQVSTTPEGIPKITMSYKVESGNVEETLYGITLAKAMDFPRRFIEVAESVSLELRRRRQQNKESSEARKMLNRRKLILQLYGHLKQANKSEMDSPTLMAYLARLREEFIEQMEAFEDGGNMAGGTEETSSEVDNTDIYDDDVFDSVDLQSLSVRSSAL